MTLVYEEDDFLEHYGVKGMKWGKRKSSAELASEGPSTGRALLLGAYGNSKKRYTDPVALKKRTAAGKNATASLLLYAGHQAANAIANNTSNPSVALGANIASGLLGLGTAATGIASGVQTGQSIKIERAARAAG